MYRRQMQADRQTPGPSPPTEKQGDDQDKVADAEQAIEHVFLDRLEALQEIEGYMRGQRSTKQGCDTP